ncbi:Fanconi anemia group M protein [Toxocara canis]|uniref:Fanconi anemia group M protein n=1 Tax=Toxocara canis TaxID=6265 RepID=A0A0B2UXY9_TOXCA|nr:Fanconi anemia group M protein [Toxocara canis]
MKIRVANISRPYTSTHKWMKEQKLGIDIRYMEPFGFAHLRQQNAHDPSSSWRISDRARERLKNAANEIRSSKAQIASMKRLYYPVNTPACRYQKQLVLDSLFRNVLIALPKELDSFFVASVVMMNFRRWFPHNKVLYVGSTTDIVRRMADVFVDLTGYTKNDICIYGAKKKCDRLAEWCNYGVVFATAEMLSADMKDGRMGSDVCLVVADDAQRAVSGSHMLCEMIRTFILNKGNFRILALTDNRITKVASLQLIVMNLQIGLIRSQSAFKDDISLTVSSPRMQEIYVSITHEMELVANALVEVGSIIYMYICIYIIS